MIEPMRLKAAIDQAVEALYANPGTGDRFEIAKERDAWLAYLLESIEERAGDEEIETIQGLCARRLEDGSW